MIFLKKKINHVVVVLTYASSSKVFIESPYFLERIQGDIFGPIYPLYGPFRYFIVLIDASYEW